MGTDSSRKSKTNTRRKAIAEQKRIARRKQKEFEQILLVGGSVFVGIVIFFGVLFGVLH